MATMRIVCQCPLVEPCTCGAEEARITPTGWAIGSQPIGKVWRPVAPTTV